MSPNSPLLRPEGPGKNIHERPRTSLISREIRKAMRKMEYTWRPYVLRAYFSSALDICENKGLVSHNWREYWTGHTGDISARYSTNKKLTQDKIDEMRETYKKCVPYLETRRRPLTEEEKENINKDAKRWYLTVMGFTDEEIEKGDLLNLEAKELQKKVREKMGMNFNNGHKQRVIPLKDVESFVEKGWDFVSSLPGEKAIIKLPDKF